MAILNQKREFWLQHIDAWQHSGLPPFDYIKTHELREGRLLTPHKA